MKPMKPETAKGLITSGLRHVTVGMMMLRIARYHGYAVYKKCGPVADETLKASGPAIAQTSVPGATQFERNRRAIAKASDNRAKASV